MFTHPRALTARALHPAAPTLALGLSGIVVKRQKVVVRRLPRLGSSPSGQKDTPMSEALSTLIEKGWYKLVTRKREEKRDLSSKFL